jgi:hypothetical protein
MLKVLQQQFSVDILQNGNCANYLSNGNFNGKDLIKIYRNNYYITLTSVLSSTYSCIKRLVGKDFFKFLSKQYIDENQPTSGNIINYGDSFANFIANCKQCDSLPYLSDVAKLEFYFEKCYFSKNQEFVLDSKYPIIQIWQIDENSDDLDLNKGGDCIKIYKHNQEVLVEKIRG